MELPNNLKAAIESKAEGLSQTRLVRAAEAITGMYRTESGQGKRLVKNDLDVLTYAIVRMPATYGAVSSALSAALPRVEGPIKTVLDVGAGTGTATWAAAELLEEAEQFTCLEREPAMMQFGQSLMSGEAFASRVQWVNADMCSFRPEKTYDLVIASYSLNELSETGRGAVVEKLWQCTNRLLLIVEPGTPVAFAQLRQSRNQLLALGGFVAAPCPHGGPCPMSGEDWCHFTCRVARSRLHKQLKKADVPYEDEKYAYLAVIRSEPTPGGMRVLRHPQVESGKITLQLCTETGIETKVITKKQKESFKIARKARCGDCVTL